MKRVLWLLPIAVAAPAQAQPDGLHAFSVQDSIEMVRFSDPSASELNSHTKFSPDGKHFAVVTSRGILASNSVESTLWLYETKAVESFAENPTNRSAPQPAKIADVVAVPQVIATAPYESMITALRWSQDSRTLYFLAQDATGNRRLSGVDILRHQTRTLTQSGYDVYQYALSRGTIVFSALRSLRAKDQDKRSVREGGHAVAGIPLEDLLLKDEKFSMVVRQVWVVHLDTGRASRLSPLDENQHFTADTTDSALALSPDGNFAALLTPVKKIPESWAKYQPASGQEHQRIAPNDSRRVSSADLDFNRLVEFSVVDLRNGSSHPLGAPMARQLGYFSKSKAVWSHDGKSLLLTNTFLPLTPATAGTQERERPCVAALVTVATMHLSCIAFYKSAPEFSDVLGGSQLKDASFRQTDGDIELLTGKYEGIQQIRQYRHEGQGWRFFSATEVDSKEGTTFDQIAEAERRLPHVSIHQSLNDPPTLQAATGQATGSALLWNPNPQFENMSLGETTVLRWKDRQGYEWTGGLVKPVGYVPGKRYPLVIQMYQFHDKEFMTDGMSTTAMAARPLASVGIMFLQITKKFHTFDPTEMADHLEGMLSAIDTLDRDGLVDPAKVGLIGFSASCPYVEYALIKAPGRFAAATIADGIDNSYMQAMLWGPSNVGLQEQYQRMNGGLPVGKGLEQWFRVAPNFQLDRVETPLRIEAIRPVSLLSEWELYSSLVQQKKPVDFIYIPEGQHILQKPRDRMVSQQGNVDWFLFWLRNEQNPHPNDKEQYQRWNELMKP